ncbi:MAG: hypothetical protein IKZ38_01425 [Clostridia bacterium]|nr:hypothetical protein [Clostridia bacterium]
MEQETVKKETVEHNVLTEIFINLKRSVLLVLTIIIAVLGIGYAYARLREPEYIAEEQVIFSMGDGTYIQSEINAMYAHHPTVLDFVDSGVVVDRANFYYEYFLSKKTSGDYTVDRFVADVSFAEEIINVCEQEKSITLLRQQKIKDLENIDSSIAENTYKQTRIEIESLQQQIYLMEKVRDLMMEINELDGKKDKLLIEQKQEELLSWKEKIIQVKRGLNVSSNGPIPKTEDLIQDLDYNVNFYRKNMPWYYDVEQYKEAGKAGVTPENGIYADRIGVVSYEGNQERSAFVSGITYKDSSSEAAMDKAKIIVLAFDIETLNFFDNMNARINDLGISSCSVDITTTKIMIASAIIGFVVACGVVYLRIVLDKTVKDKAEAEKITGATVLACISKGDE